MKHKFKIVFCKLALVVLVLSPLLNCSPLPASGADAITLPEPIVTGESVELCLNSRYSDHSLSGTASDQQLSNVLWAAGSPPVTGTYRDIYVSMPDATYSYDPGSHSLSWYSNEIADQCAFAISYETELDFDAGVSYMPALLGSVSLWKSTESESVASCPRITDLCFGVQQVSGLTDELVAFSSDDSLPPPSTSGDNNLAVVLANLKYTSDFAQTNLTLQQISQLLWAGYGCTPHLVSSNRAGLTVPSAYADYYLTGKIYLVNENGVYRYHNRLPPGTDLTTRDHRIEQIDSDDIRNSLKSAVSGLPEAPCYAILCLDNAYIEQKAVEHNTSNAQIEASAHLETGFVASNILIQASAIGLGCHFNTELTSAEQVSIQNTTGIPLSHVPQVVISVGSTIEPGLMPPTITSLSPNQGIQGDTLDVTITGTYFTGTTSVSFGSGITVNSFNVNNATRITASITIDDSATVGARDVSVTTPAGTGTLPDDFTVKEKGNEAGGCSCSHAKANTSASELLVVWGTFGLCLATGYGLTKRLGKKGRK